MDDVKRMLYVDTAFVADHLGITEDYVRVLTQRGWFHVRAVKQTGKAGRPPALYNLHEVEQAWQERNRTLVNGAVDLVGSQG